MGEQCSHAQPGVRGQDTKLDLQLCGDALRSILHPLEQFPTDLKAERIGDDNNNTVLCVFNMPGKEVNLRRNTCKRIPIGKSGVPFGQQFGQELIGIDVFCQFPERFKISRVRKLVIGKVEPPVRGINLTICIPVLIHNSLEPIRTMIGGGSYQMICAVKKAVRLFHLRAKVHLLPFFTDLRNRQSPQLCANVLVQEPVSHPLDENLVNAEECIAPCQILRQVSGKDRSSIQAFCDMSGQCIVGFPIDHAIHQVVEKGDNVAGLIGLEHLPWFWQLRPDILCSIGYKHSDGQLLQCRLDIGIAKMLFAELPESVQQIIPFKLSHEAVIRQPSASQHHPDYILIGTGAGKA